VIDAHIHLDQYPPHQIEEQISKWQVNGIEGVVAVSTNLKSSYDILSLKASFPHFIYPCLGWHPEQPLPTDKELNELIQLIRLEKDQINGIGEIGIPHYSLEQLGNPPLEPYIELFELFTKEAAALSLPVNIHAVHDKALLALEILKKEKLAKVHFHWLKAESTVLQELIKQGYLISITPEICYRKRDEQLALNTPLEQLLLETDGPWPFSGPFSGKLTSPLFLFSSMRKLSTLKERPISQIRSQLRKNFERLYLK
jgi:TatD DNase family protein